MSAKGAPWQHTASAAPQYSPNRLSKFTLQEGLDNNWVFFPEPHFVNIDDEDEDSSEEDNHEQSDRRDSVNSVGSVSEDKQRRPGMQQRGDSWSLKCSPLKDLMSYLRFSSIDATKSQYRRSTPIPQTPPLKPLLKPPKTPSIESLLESFTPFAPTTGCIFYYYLISGLASLDIEPIF